MPLQRYLLVEAALDSDGNILPVTNPHLGPLRTGDSASFVGAQLKAVPPKDALSMAEAFEVSPQVIVDHHDLRRAAKKGCLKILAQVAAKSHDEALPKLRAEAERLKSEAAAKAVKKGSDK